ncbi:NfeD family protein [uncultured Martelella sp.]|uniref:NfeD family protein n=1 Tax=uncultured Martelella sp. TaxID=392331 RepID=UPI0029C6E5A4|nr:NfeD family protein [uncultured Martelella sp.]
MEALFDFFTAAGPWGWFIAGLLLLVAELLLPGVFLMWVGIAAIILGALSLVFWPFGFWGWQLQILLFAVLSVVAIVVGRRILKNRETTSDEPLLNQRAASLVGRTAIVVDAITDGRGRIRLDDTLWVVEGPDLPAGAHVHIVAGDGRKLTVAPLEKA